MLRDLDEKEYTTNAEICKYTTSYYRDLFSSQDHSENIKRLVVKSRTRYLKKSHLT